MSVERDREKLMCEMSIEEAERHLEVLAAHAEKGERIVITRDGRAVAHLGPPPLPKDTFEEAPEA
jgi:antitoxin (DNA-binding transcriptional repressor) of toxin-antitoxin stability system